MIVLTDTDKAFLRNLVSQITQGDEEADKTYDVLTAGYEQYADAEMISGVKDQEPTQEEKEAFFKASILRLRDNIRYAGKKSEEVFFQIQDHLYNTFKRLGIPARDQEDMVQLAIMKFWRFKHAESYNPLISSWNHHLYLSLSRMAASYWEKKSRDPLAQAFEYQHYESSDQDVSSDEFNLEPYELEQDMTPEQKLLVQEVLQDFENYLKTQKPYRTGVVGNHRDVCTMAAPGIPEHPTDDKLTVFMVRKGTNNSRIELMDGSGKRYLCPTNLLDDIRPNTQKNSAIEDDKRVERTPLGLFKILMTKGAQIEEVAAELLVGESTAHNWIRQLEDTYKEWWIKSSLIPFNVKWMTRPTTICPGCKFSHQELPEESVKSAVEDDIEGVKHWKAHPENNCKQTTQVKAKWCDVCNEFALDRVDTQMELSFPWGQVRHSHELVERSQKYKQKMQIQRCGL